MRSSRIASPRSVQPHACFGGCRGRLASIPASNILDSRCAPASAEARGHDAASDVISVNGVFWTEGTHFAAVITMRESTSPGMEATRVVRLSGQVDPASTEEDTSPGSGSGAAHHDGRQLRACWRATGVQRQCQNTWVCFDQQAAADVAVAGSACVAVHLGVVDGGRDPNMEPSLKLMVLIHGHSSSGQDENLDQEAHTLILHMDRYNGARSLPHGAEL